MNRQELPPEAAGHEDVYRRFLSGKLIYRPTAGKDEGLIELPIARLANPLDGCFDLSRCGDVGKHLSIHTGYRKGKIPENANKTEVWLAPRFLVERDLGSPPRNFGKILEQWDSTIPFGIYFTWGNWDNLEWYDYEVRKLPEILNNEHLYQIYGQAVRNPTDRMTPAGSITPWSGLPCVVSSRAKISILFSRD